MVGSVAKVATERFSLGQTPREEDSDLALTLLLVTHFFELVKLAVKHALAGRAPFRIVKTLLDDQLALIGVSERPNLQDNFRVLIGLLEFSLADLENLRRVDPRAKIQEAINWYLAAQRLKR